MKQWILPYIRLFNKRLAFTLLFGFLGIASGASLLFVSGYLISKSALRPENIMIVYVPIVLVRAFSIGQAVFLYLNQLVSHDLVLRILEKMRRKLYDIVEPQAPHLKSRYQTGDLLGILSDDIEHLQDFYLKTIFPSLIGLIVFTGFNLVIGLFDLQFMILTLLMTGVLLFLLPFISLLSVRKKHTEKKHATSEMYRNLTDQLFGQTDIAASGRLEEQLNQLAKTNKRMTKVNEDLQRFHYRRDALIQLIFAVVIGMMLLWTNEMTNNEQFTPTFVAAFVLMTFSVLDALIPVSNAVEHTPSYTDSLNRMNEIFNTKEVDRPTIDSQINRTVENDHLVIKNLHFSYPNMQTDILKSLDLDIAFGKKIAILGRSGAGKSTLLKLLTGMLQPTDGEILIDHKTVTTDYLGKTISVLNQKPHLFQTTIANNIRLGREDATDEEIQDVIERAQLTSLIEQLPKGIHTSMEEMGKRFSGGERQRIAFARVLLQDTPIIILDEPTVGLDAITERLLLDTMFQAAKDKTIIWVTHHLANASKMDEIIFLQNGEIAIQGRHDQLLKTNELYKRLYEMDQC